MIMKQSVHFTCAVLEKETFTDSGEETQSVVEEVEEDRNTQESGKIEHNPTCNVCKQK